MQTAEPLVTEPSCFKIEISIENLKIYKSCNGQIPVEVIHAGGNIAEDPQTHYLYLE
jgi:hypothetical protein